MPTVGFGLRYYCWLKMVLDVFVESGDMRCWLSGSGLAEDHQG